MPTCYDNTLRDSIINEPGRTDHIWNFYGNAIFVSQAYVGSITPQVLVRFYNNARIARHPPTPLPKKRRGRRKSKEWKCQNVEAHFAPNKDRSSITSRKVVKRFIANLFLPSINIQSTTLTYPRRANLFYFKDYPNTLYSCC